MSLFRISSGEITALDKTTFANQNILERNDLQQALKHNIDVIAPECLVISEEFSYWQDSKKRIDLLAIDKNANLVVIELKRDETGSHMDLQAIRYASMVSPLTYEQACKYFQKYLDKNTPNEHNDAEEIIKDFLDWDEPEKDDFAQDVRVVLVSADFSKELTTSALWLRDKGIDISCVRLSPYKYQDETLINAEQIIPVPETAEYLIKVKEKTNERRTAISGKKDYSKYRYKDEIYNKRYLALAIMKDWIEKQKPKNLGDIHSVFVEKVHKKIAQNINHIPDSQQRRYHVHEESLIRLESNEIIAISNQWGLDSIHRLLELTSKFGVEVEVIN
ncbi:MAG: hypothetical protein HWE16_05835 [Gammaproteobacteria bacterium]|nr:hypothetical protein [Gammaproteobacteria bacterium]